MEEEEKEEEEQEEEEEEVLLAACSKVVSDCWGEWGLQHTLLFVFR